MKNQFVKIKPSTIVLYSAIFTLFLLAFVAFKYFNFRHIIKDYAFILLDKQKLIVEVPPEIDVNDISIIWNGPEYKNTEIFSKKNSWGRVNKFNGNNSFSVLYRNELIKTVGHFVITKNSLHNYLFKFYTQNNKINFTFNVIGPDSVTCKEWDEMYHWTKSPSISKFNESSLKLRGGSSTIKNTIDFTIRAENLERLLKPNIDTTLKGIVCLINGKSFNVKDLKNRGASALSFSRKCYNATLKDSAIFIDNQGLKRKSKSFSLISLSMDHYYFRNRIAHEMLKELQLLNMFYTFSEVKMNTETQGIYLIIENPKKHLLDSLHASFFIRRGYEYCSYIDRNEKVVLDYSAQNYITLKEVEFFIDRFKSIYALIYEKKGIELYQSLERIMDIKEYMRFMAFNFIICNHDYTDEQFFYINKLNKSNRFNIMPWDFDDILGNTPHEGWQLRNELIKDKLIYSREDKLDLVIATDSVLYNKYLTELSQIANRLDTSLLKTIYQNTYSELFPFFVNEEIISKSILDESSMKYSLADLECQLNGTYWFLVQRINSIRLKLNSLKVKP